MNVFGSNNLQSGTSPALKLYYNGHGTPVSILYAHTSIIIIVTRKIFLFTLILEKSNFSCGRLEESGVITDCKIRTVHFDPVLDYDFGSANVIGRIIMSSECLKGNVCLSMKTLIFVNNLNVFQRCFVSWTQLVILFNSLCLLILQIFGSQHLVIQGPIM